MTLTDLLDQRLRRELDHRYPYGWWVGFDEQGRLVIWFRMMPSEAEVKE